MSGTMNRTRGRLGFANLQVLTSAKMPSLLRRAAATRGLTTASAYVRVVLVDALVRDLGLDRDELVKSLGEMPHEWKLGGAWHQMPRNTDVR